MKLRGNGSVIWPFLNSTLSVACGVSGNGCSTGISSFEVDVSNAADVAGGSAFILMVPG